MSRISSVRSLNIRMWTYILSLVGFDKQKLVIYGLIAALVAACGLYVWINEGKKDRLESAISAANTRIEALELTNKSIQADNQRIKENAQSMIDNMAKIRSEAAERQRTLTEHDLGEIGDKKPNLLEDRVNKGTRDQLKRLEEATR